MSDVVLREIRDLIQLDVNHRGLATDPEANLLNACPDDFAAACRSIAETPSPAACVVTGFFIPHGQPPSCETDGPLGAVFLARALSALGVPVLLVADATMGGAIEAGLDAAHVTAESSCVATAYIDKPPHDIAWVESLISTGADPYTHLISLERVGPSHADGRCHTMRGLDVSDHAAPAHLLFARAARQDPPLTTIGIGDGGNEIGMGKIPWDVVRRNVPNGGLIACRVPTDYLIVCGVSNWGAYALAAGVAHLRGVKLDSSLFDPERERELLRIMVEKGPLVDGVTGRPSVSVDGLPFDEYIKPLLRIKDILGC